jgi:hypothetical protein
VNAHRNRLFLLSVAFVPIVVIILSINLDWPLVEMIGGAIFGSLLISAFLVFKGWKTGVSWIVFWVICLILFTPYANIVFVLVNGKKLCKVSGANLSRKH